MCLFGIIFREVYKANCNNYNMLFDFSSIQKAFSYPIPMKNREVAEENIKIATELENQGIAGPRSVST